MAVQLVFHPRDERVERRPIGSRRAGRRHHPGAQLQRHFLANRRLIGQPRQVELVQSQSTGFQARVVTADAIFVEHRARRGHVRRRIRSGDRPLWLRPLAGHGRHRQNCQEAADEDALGHARLSQHARSQCVMLEPGLPEGQPTYSRVGPGSQSLSRSHVMRHLHALAVACLSCPAASGSVSSP